jgi:hypothetical protein
MEIICNNCSREVSFQNDQYFVICPYCYTHLQIEENDKTISVEIITPSSKDDSKSFFLAKTISVEALKSPVNDDVKRPFNSIALMNLSLLEDSYKFHFIESQFRSILMAHRFRPILGYGLAKLSIGISFGFMCLDSLSKVENTFYFAVRIAGIFFGIFLIFKAFKEFIRWILIGRFEQTYFEEKNTLIKVIGEMDLPDNLQQPFENYKQTHEAYWNIKKTNSSVEIKEYIYKLKAKNSGEIFFFSFGILFTGNAILSSQFGSINMFLINLIIVGVSILGFRLFQKRSNSNIKFDGYQNQIREFIKALKP